MSLHNGLRIYQLNKTLSTLTLGHDLVINSYGRLKAIWDELSLHDTIPECTCGQLKVITKRQHRDYVIQFHHLIFAKSSPFHAQRYKLAIGLFHFYS